MTKYLLGNEGDAMDQKRVNSFPKEHLTGTEYADYSWDYYIVDE